MVGPDECRFHPVSEYFAKAYAREHVDPSSAVSHIARDWTVFSEGETVTVKGMQFRVYEIGETRMVLKPISA